MDIWKPPGNAGAQPDPTIYEEFQDDTYDERFLAGFLSGRAPDGSSEVERKSVITRFPALSRSSKAPRPSSMLSREASSRASSRHSTAEQEPDRCGLPRRSRYADDVGLSPRKTSPKALQIEREACDSIRTLIFDGVGNESWKDSQKHLIYEQARGSSEEMRRFVEFWVAMDEDGSGTIETDEFLNFFKRRRQDRSLGIRIMRYVTGFRSAKTGEPRSWTMGDLMKLVWLEAKEEDVEAMLQMFKIHRLSGLKVQPLPLLPKKMRRQLEKNFQLIDHDEDGFITFTDMVEAGFIGLDDVCKLRKTYGREDKTGLDITDFVEMLCPNGFQASEKARSAYDINGKRIHHISIDEDCKQFDGWLLEEDAEAHVWWMPPTGTE